MIELTAFIGQHAEENWPHFQRWLSENIAPVKLSKINIVQGTTWLLVRKGSLLDSYSYFLYFDEPRDEVMFKLACL